MDDSVTTWIQLFSIIPTRIFTIGAFVWLIDRMNKRYLATILQTKIDNHGE